MSRLRAIGHRSSRSVFSIALLAAAVGACTAPRISHAVQEAAAHDATQTKRPLLAFDAATLERAAARNVKATPASGGLRLDVTGGDGPATLTFEAPGGKWDLGGRTLVTRVRNVGERAVTLRLRIENPEAKGLHDTCQMPVLLSPGETQELALRVIARPEDPTYEPFKPFMMYFKNISVRDNTVDPANVVRLVIAVDRPEAGQRVEVAPIDVTGAPDAAQPKFFPFIDRYGQYVHSNWPGKIRSDDDFQHRRAEEARERGDFAGPADWNQYGGWAKGPKLNATGFFRTEKHEGKWWLVDPEGRLYWSYGPTGVGFGGDATPIDGREHWFRDLPARDDPRWGSFYRRGRGATYMYYRNREWVGFDVARANLVGKYGAEYEKAVSDVSHERLRSWGFNTMANWSDPAIYLQRKTPYTVAIHAGGGSSMRWSDGHSFQDVYDPAWEPGLYARMEQERGKTAGDPWNLGYFVDNERSIGWRPRAAAVGEMALKAPADQPAKRKFIEQLKAKYPTIDALNQAWTAQYASWDALADSTEPPPFKGADGKDNAGLLTDCGDFGMMFCERYFSVCREAVKRVAPNNLFLGSRLYGHTDPAVVALAAKYWDVISYNIYDNPPDGRANQYRAIDKPIMSTEWGVGSDPTQTPFRGADVSVDPNERTRLITQYAQRAIRHPNMVGAHFFQYRDQPISGRPDGEATLRGFVNIVDTPNFELVQTNRAIGYKLYEMRSSAR